MDFSKNKGVRKLEIVTNGSLIDESKAKMLSRYLEYVCISLHGHDKKSHENITRTAKSFEEALKGIKLLQDEGCRILIYFTIMRENFDSIPKMFDLVRELNCDGIRFNCLYLAGRAKEKEAISIEGKKLLSSYIEKMAIEKNVKLISSELHREEYLNNIQSYKFYGCNALRSLIYVGADGTAYPCSLMLDLPVGNIYTNSLLEIWKSALARKTRSLNCPPNKNFCTKIYDCGGLCKARSASFASTLID